MKSKIFTLLTICFLAISCTTENEEDATVTIAINSETRVVSVQELSSMIEKLDIETTSKIRINCSQEMILVYWHGAAHNTNLGFEALRQSIRDDFMANHGLDNYLMALPQTNQELWIFFEDGTYPCHTTGVSASVNNNGGGVVTTDGD